ncbi:hypothetical protein LOTGIDRAFT_128853 [Lottia gigantea]|uniref:Cleavage and polyadenylation specificity factor subunit 1 n=1 Tax=Lottia gigantea TaxID=225164 RepID=V3ZQB0_LOTGI|nr:hypothetical protein LOTGIDRAFT_128853 [Lottia gigantea]ESO86522.1 hypothetical protein LOTGIDRAFT_128853 [Lottia gigantea]
MYSVYKQIHKPTGIEHSIYCNLYSTDEKNLVLAGVNQLSIYRLNIDAEVITSSDGDKSEESRRTKLECVGTYSLFGNVMSLQAVRLPGAVRDSLVLSFFDAKLSVLEYDPATHNLKTSSLHQFEESDLKDGFTRPEGIPTIRVDPDGRCAAMCIYTNRLVILPFKRDVVIDDIDQATPGGTTTSPIMSTYIVDLRKLDEKITNVKDFQFLHGYHEPTVFILYEPLRTWAGRTAVRTDTSCIVAISLNIQQKVHPIIWHINSLPFDCFGCIAIPKPIGGALLFANNSLLYLNQSVPPYAVSLNSIAETCSAFPLRPQEGVRMALDCSQATMISYDKLVLSLKGGELYVLTLVVDGMRTVRSFHFDKAASSVLTTCICQCDDGYLFLGSRLGNSLLLKYTEKDQVKTDKTDIDRKTAEPSNKKRKLEGSEHLASDVTEIDNLDELEVYGVSETASTTITSYSFEVCDNIWNIAPCGQIEMGEPAFLSEEFGNSVDPDLELVTTSGYGKNGALSVLQRSIRPQVVTTFELPDCVDMWTVFNQQDDEQQVGDESEDSPKPIKGGHSFLILSRPDSSMVLQTGNEIMELDHSGFSTQSPTVFAGNIGDNKYILQVSTNSIRLLEGVKQLQHIPLDTGSIVVQCSVADPYVVIMMEDGQIMLLTLKQDSYGSGVRLAVTRPQISMKSKILVVTAYKDMSGMFTTSDIKDTELDQAMDEKHHEKVVQLDDSNIEDEDELLYGASDTSVFGTSFTGSSSVQTTSTDKRKKKKEAKDIIPSYWSILCRENGELEIYSVPEFKACYYVKNFPGGHRVLVDSGQEVKGQKERESYLELPKVKELLVVGLGYNKSHPYLLARVEEELFIYEAFPFQPTQSDKQHHLKIRFKRFQHDLILKSRKTGKSKKKGEMEEVIPKKSFVQSLRYFDDVSGYAGVFVCGAYPHWLFMTTKGELRVHPMNIDGYVVCFTQFNNVNCPKGFLYFNTQNEMRICILPTHVTYDAPWPVRKLPLRCTPHYIGYHTDSKTYAVVTSRQEIFNKQSKITQLDEREFEVVEKDERFVYPTDDVFTLQLFTPSTWEVIPNSHYEFEEWEQVTSLKCVKLKSEGTVSGLKGFIAVGTMYCYGEEISSKGRVLIFEVIEVVPEPGQPLTKTKIKLLLEKEQKGPITAMADCNGYLVTAIGQKLYMWTLKDHDLAGVAFIDTYVYIHSLCTIKNLIVAGDLIKSIAVYRYQEDYKVLSLASRDIKPCEVYGVNFLVDNNVLNFVVSDRNKNILVYSYQPEARESVGGQRLIRKADFNMGSHINSFFRVRCKLSDPSIDKKTLALVENRHVTYFATLDGSLGFLLPVTEKVYRRLTMLQSIMLTLIPHLAGLNPKGYRAIKTTFPELSNPCRNILDGELLWRFVHLSHNEKNEVSKRIGTSTDQLMDDLMEINRVTAHF